MTDKGNRNDKGQVGKGNQIAKKDFTKELARHTCSQEMYWCAKMICDTPTKDLKEMIANDSIENESLLTYMTIKSAVLKNEFKPVQFLIEMINGKAKQQIEADLGGNIIVNVAQHKKKNDD